MKLCYLTAFFILIFSRVGANRKLTRNVEITAEQEKLRDPEGFAAIKELHRLMDDDQSGSIDRFESADFLTEDLNLGGSDRARREKAFHHNNDESITVDDLWEAWFQSEERDWNNKEVIDWLKSAVKLPQYEKSFESAKVSGIALPRMALQNSSYITNALGIKNFVHRQKLQLKALDVVLFGFQDTSSRAKDIALAALLVLLITILIVFKTHKNRSKRQMEEMSTRLSELMNMETDFEGAQQRLEEDRQRRHSLIESEHIEALKNQLMEAERRIEMNGYDSIPFTLQPLLRRTYEMESAYINAQKLECLNEMREAKDFVDKIRRKQSGLMASFKIATGTGSTTDDIDTRIFTLKGRMEKIKLAMDECVNRWMEIESLCGFSITGPFGVATAAPNAQVITPNGDAPSAYLAQQLINKGPKMGTTAAASLCSGKSTPPSAFPSKYSTVTTAQMTSSGTSVYDEYNSVRDFAQLNAHQHQPQQVGTLDDWVVNGAPLEPIVDRNDRHIAYNAPSPPLSKFSLQHSSIHNSTSDDTQSLSSSNSKTVSSKKSNKFTQLLRRKLNNNLKQK